MNLLIFNCWSNSVAFHLMEGINKRLLASGSVKRVALDSGTMTVQIPGEPRWEKPFEYLNHGAAIQAVANLINDGRAALLPETGRIDAIAHRVVHGGEKFRQSIFLDDSVVEELRELAPLAPLHTPHNIAGIEAARELLPHIPHVAVFDTAFHQTLPPAAYLYPLPYDWYETKGIRRYGFHGHAHRFALQRASAFLGKEVSSCNVVSIAIGRGISVCAIRDGISVDTSMGLTPLEGVATDTRCGDVDPGLTVFMMERLNLTPSDIYRIFNEKSGLMGLAGSSSRIELADRAANGDAQAKVALAIQGYRLKKQIGSYIAGIGKTDAVIFSHSAKKHDWRLRERCLEGLECMGVCLDHTRNRTADSSREEVISAESSPVSVMAIPAHPEVAMCEEVMELLGRA